MSEDRIRDLEDRVQQLEKRLSSAQHSRYYGYEYKSAITVWGWPLLHIAQGIDPESGRLLCLWGPNNSSAQYCRTLI